MAKTSSERIELYLRRIRRIYRRDANQRIEEAERAFKTRTDAIRHQALIDLNAVKAENAKLLEERASLVGAMGAIASTARKYRQDHGQRRICYRESKCVICKEFDQQQKNANDAGIAKTDMSRSGVCSSQAERPAVTTSMYMVALPESTTGMASVQNTSVTTSAPPSEPEAVKDFRSIAITETELAVLYAYDTLSDRLKRAEELLRMAKLWIGQPAWTGVQLLISDFLAGKGPL